MPVNGRSGTGGAGATAGVVGVSVRVVVSFIVVVTSVGEKGASMECSFGGPLLLPWPSDVISAPAGGD